MFCFNKILFLILIFPWNLSLQQNWECESAASLKSCNVFVLGSNFTDLPPQMQSCVSLVAEKCHNLCFLQNWCRFSVELPMESCEKSESRICSSICLFDRISIIFHISTLNIAIQFWPLNRFWSQVYNVKWNFQPTKIDYAHHRFIDFDPKCPKLYNITS